MAWAGCPLAGSRGLAGLGGSAIGHTVTQDLALDPQLLAQRLFGLAGQFVAGHQFANAIKAACANLHRKACRRAFDPQDRLEPWLPPRELPRCRQVAGIALHQPAARRLAAVLQRRRLLDNRRLLHNSGLFGGWWLCSGFAAAPAPAGWPTGAPSILRGPLLPFRPIAPWFLLEASWPWRTGEPS